MSHAVSVTVQVRDGHVIYDEGRAVTITPTGDLIVFDADRAEVARFEVGNWLDAGVNYADT